MKLVAPQTPKITIKLFPKPFTSKVEEKIYHREMIREVEAAINEWYYLDLTNW